MPLQGHLINEDGRSQAECRQINIGVELGPEGRGAFQQARKIAVEAVQYHRQHDELGRQKEVFFAFDGQQYAEKAAQHGQQRDHRWNYLTPAHFRSLPSIFDLTLATTVSPARTLSPGLAITSTSSAGKYMSSREPNFIIPMRSPFATGCPSSSQ